MTADTHPILIVDDDPEARSTLRGCLQSHGYRTLEAESGFDALAVLSEQRPSLIILDLVMPEMNGWELVGAIQTLDDPAVRRVPMIVLSPTDLDAHHTVLRGAASYLRKPIDVVMLLEAVRLAQELAADMAQRPPGTSGDR